MSKSEKQVGCGLEFMIRNDEKLEMFFERPSSPTSLRPRF